jgi:hypothetical protein
VGSRPPPASIGGSHKFSFDITFLQIHSKKEDSWGKAWPRVSVHEMIGLIVGSTRRTSLGRISRLVFLPNRHHQLHRSAAKQSSHCNLRQVAQSRQEVEFGRRPPPHPRCFGHNMQSGLCDGFCVPSSDREQSHLKELSDSQINIHWILAVHWNHQSIPYAFNHSPAFAFYFFFAKLIEWTGWRNESTSGRQFVLACFPERFLVFSEEFRRSKEKFPEELKVDTMIRQTLNGS